MSKSKSQNEIIRIPAPLLAHWILIASGVLLLAWGVNLPAALGVLALLVAARGR